MTAYHCFALGTTITRGRQKIADFCAPYVISGQLLVADARRQPSMRGIANLHGLVICSYDCERISGADGQ